MNLTACTLFPSSYLWIPFANGEGNHRDVKEDSQPLETCEVPVPSSGRDDQVNCLYKMYYNLYSRLYMIKKIQISHFALIIFKLVRVSENYVTKLRSKVTFHFKKSFGFGVLLTAILVLRE